MFAISSCHLRRARRSATFLLTAAVLVLLCLLPKASVLLETVFVVPLFFREKNQLRGQKIRKNKTERINNKKINNRNQRKGGS